MLQQSQRLHKVAEQSSCEEILAPCTPQRLGCKGERTYINNFQEEKLTVVDCRDHQSLINCQLSRFLQIFSYLQNQLRFKMQLGSLIHLSTFISFISVQIIGDSKKTSQCAFSGLFKNLLMNLLKLSVALVT